MHRKSWKSSSPPRIAGVQWSSTVESTRWGMAPGVAVILGIVLGLAEITPVSWRLQRTTWWRSEGPAGQGLILVMAGVASESPAHAVRGFRGRESTKEAWGVGSIVAEAVPSTSCIASQVPTVSSQRPEWQSSDRSWRTRFRSQPLWGMAA